MKTLLTTLLIRYYRAFLAFDKAAREDYRIEDEAHRAEFGLPLSMMI